MKYILSIIMMCISLNVSGAMNLTGLYYGTINPFVDSEYKYVSISEYRFKGNTYDFTTGLKGTRAEKEIPSKYHAEGFYSEKGTYSIETINGINYINFFSETAFTYKKRLGLLVNDRRLFLYENNGLFFMPDEDLRWEGMMPSTTKVIPSSHFLEGRLSYDGNSFVSLKNILPWVEGKDDYGIGEWIMLTVKKQTYLPVSSFIIANGYVSFEKPYLYEYNSRIKKLRIVCEEAKIDFMVELEDTSQLQTIKLPHPIELDEAKIKFIIMDVYKGSRWKDTCISLIYPLGTIPR